MTVPNVSKTSRYASGPPLNPHRKRNRVFSIVAVCALLGFLMIARNQFGNYVMLVLNLCAIYAIAALSMNLVNGFTGQFSLGQAGFMCLGAYTTALLVSAPEVKYASFYLKPIVPWLGTMQLPFGVALLIGGAIAAIAAFLVGFPVLRLRGDYLAIASLGFSEIIRVIVNKAQTVTNGALGIKNIPRIPSLYREWMPDFLKGILGENTIVTFLVLGLTVAFLILLIQTSFGRALKSIREDEIAAQAMGVNLFSHKLTAFVISGFLAGLAGGLLACHITTVDPKQFIYTLTYSILLMVVLGGQGSVSGSVVGAFIVTIAQEVLRFLDEPIAFLHYPGISGMRMVVFSALLMLVILFWSRGIFGTNEFSWDGLARLFGRLTNRKGAER